MKKSIIFLDFVGIALLIFSLFLPAKISQAGETKTVLCLGDSITNGYPYAGTSKTYPARLEEKLKTTTNYYTYNVINYGVNGYRADQVLDSLRNKNWLDVNPDFVLLMIGGNDLAQEIKSSDPSHISEVIDQTVSEVQSIVDLVKNHTNPDGNSPQILVSAFPPNNLAGAGGSLVVAAYNNKLQTDLTKVDLWFTTNWDDLYDPDTGQADPSLMFDSVHPNEEGYAIIADNWFEAITPLLPKDPENKKDKSGNKITNLKKSSFKFSPHILVTSGREEPTRMQVYDRYGNSVGSEIKNLFPSNYLGGAGIIPIDTNRDGVQDEIIIYPLNNGGPQARLFGLRSNGQLVFRGQMFVFDKTIRDGLSMTSGDFDNDGYKDDISVCLTGDRLPIVRVYKVIPQGINNWKKISEFTAPFGAVGCNLGTFQYDNGASEILVTPHHGPADPKVYIYSTNGILVNSFISYGSGVVNGLTASGIGNRIYTTPNNGTSHVLVFDRHGNQKGFWWAYSKYVKGDFRNVPGDIDLDGKDEILISPIGSNGPHILSFEATGKWRVWPNFFGFGNKTLRNGVGGIAVIDNFYGVN